MALATIADYEAVTGATVPDSPSPERDRIERLLDMASSAVLAGAHGQNITETVYSAVRLNVHNGYGYFPQRPVSQVASVTCDGTLLTEGTGYRWTSGGNRLPALLIRVCDGADALWPSDAVLVVSYTAGWDPVPGQVAAIVVAMARSTVANRGEQPATQEGAGPFQKSWEGIETENANMTLTASAKATLDRLCGLRGPASVPVGRDQP
jgi:hypothetical protein